MKIILLAILTFVLGGCSTTSHKQKTSKQSVNETNPYKEKYGNYPWVLLAESITGSKIFVEVSTIKEVDYGIRKAWTASLDKGTSSNELGNSMFLTVYDCNTSEDSVVEYVFRVNGKLDSIKFPDSKFKQLYPTTVGYGVLQEICNHSL
jgi:PBP1b-binding outer membrane lipoprotein LpoB